MFDLVDVALQRFKQIVSSERGSKNRSEQLISWISRDVAAVVEELLRRPDFRKLVRWPIDRLMRGSSSQERLIVERVDAALVNHAKSLVAVTEDPWLRDRLAGRGAYPGYLPRHRADPNEPFGLPAIRSIAERQWRDLVSEQDYFGPSAELNLNPIGNPSARSAQMGEFLPMLREDLTLPDDHMTGMMLRRIELMASELHLFSVRCQNVLRRENRSIKNWSVVDETGGTLHQSRLALEQAVTCGPGARMRCAAIGLLQIYSEFCASPELRVLGLPPHCRPLHHFRFWMPRSDPAIPERIAAALILVIPLCRRSLTTDEVLEEAIRTHRFVMIASIGIRRLFLEGAESAAPWHANTGLWDLLWALADKARGGKAVDSFDLGEHATSRALACRINRLKSLLPALAPFINDAGRGTYRLALKAGEIYLGILSNDDKLEESKTTERPFLAVAMAE